MLNLGEQPCKYLRRNRSLLWVNRAHLFENGSRKTLHTPVIFFAQLFFRGKNCIACSFSCAQILNNTIPNFLPKVCISLKTDSVITPGVKIINGLHLSVWRGMYYSLAPLFSSLVMPRLCISLANVMRQAHVTGTLCKKSVTANAFRLKIEY